MSNGHHTKVGLVQVHPNKYLIDQKSTNKLLYLFLLYSDVAIGSIITNIPCTSTVMLTLLVLSESSIELFPVHVYTPSCVGYWASTMWRVDITLPGVIVVIK